MRRVVLLPAPLGPRNAVTRPGTAVNDRPSRTRRPPYAFTRPSTSITRRPPSLPRPSFPRPGCCPPGRPPSGRSARRRRGCGLGPPAGEVVAHRPLGVRVEAVERLVEQHQARFVRGGAEVAELLALPQESSPTSTSRRSSSSKAAARSRRSRTRSPHTPATRHNCSSAVRCSYSGGGSWTKPRRARTAGSAGGRPATVTRPASGVTRPAITRRSVLLPLPFGPVTRTVAPSGTWAS